MWAEGTARQERQARQAGRPCPCSTPLAWHASPCTAIAPRRGPQQHIASGRGPRKDQRAARVALPTTGDEGACMLLFRRAAQLRRWSLHILATHFHLKVSAATLLSPLSPQSLAHLAGVLATAQHARAQHACLELPAAVNGVAARASNVRHRHLLQAVR